MKLYHLYPKDRKTHWNPWYDKAFGFVIRAESEEEARDIASQQGGDEDWDFQYENAKQSVWQNPDYTICEVLTIEGPSEIILRDFRSA